MFSSRISKISYFFTLFFPPYSPPESLNLGNQKSRKLRVFGRKLAGISFHVIDVFFYEYYRK